MVGDAFPEAYRSAPAIVIDTTKTGYYSYKATMSGLEENTAYVYCLVTGDTVSDVYSFDVGGFGDDYTFVLAGDPQVGVSGGPQWSDTLSKIETHFPDTSFVVSAGDQTSTPTNETDYDNFIVPELSGKAIAITLGTTHDNAQPYKEHYNLPNLSSTYGVSAISSDYYYTYNSTLFMHINVESSDVESHAAFVERTIANHPECIWQIVVIHYPLYHDKMSTDAYRTGLSGLFSDLGVDAVFSGHIHRYARSKMISDELTVSDDVIAGNTVTDPVGTLYITAAPSALAGNFVEGADNMEYLEKLDWTARKSVVVFDMTETSLTMNAYYMDTDEPELFDTFTIYHTPEKVRLNKDTNMLEISDGEERIPLVDAYAYSNATVKVVDGNWSVSADGGATYTSLGIASSDTNTVLSLNAETGNWEVSSDGGASFEALPVNINKYTVTYVTDTEVADDINLSDYPTHTVSASELPDDVVLTLPTGSLSDGVLYEWAWKYYSLDGSEVNEFEAGEQYVAILSRSDLSVSNTLYLANATDAANGVYTWSEAWDIVKSFPGEQFTLLITEDITLESSAGVSLSQPVDIVIDLAGYTVDATAVTNLISLPTGADTSDINIITSKKNGTLLANSIFYANSSARTTLNLAVGSEDGEPIKVCGRYIVNAGNNFKNNSHLYLDINEGTYELTAGLFLVYNLGTNSNNYYVTVKNADVSVGVAPVCFNTYVARDTSTFSAVSSSFTYIGTNSNAPFFAANNWYGGAEFTDCVFAGITFEPSYIENVTGVVLGEGCCFENSDATFNDAKTAFASENVSLAEGCELVSVGDKVYCVPLGTIPMKEVSAAELESAYVTSGAEADTSYEAEEVLLVSGRDGDALSTGRMTYAKVDLSEYEAGTPAMLTIKSLSTNSGTINVYGVADKEESDSWSANSITYDNAPANDIDSSGVDLTEVYGASELASITVAGQGYYSADISEYVTEMKNQGAEAATVILVSATDDVSLNFAFAGADADQSLYYKVMDFDNRTDWIKKNSQTEVNSNGDMRIGSAETSTALIKEDFDRTSASGNSLELYANKTYNRFKFYNIFENNLTEEDIGKKIKVSFWVYSESDITFNMGLTSAETASTEAQEGGYNDYSKSFYTESNPTESVSAKAGVWTKVDYIITVTEEMTDEYWGDTYSAKGYKPAMFTIIPTVEGGSTMYIDDMVIEEAEAYFKSISFDDWESLKQGGNSYEVNDTYNIVVYAANSSEWSLDSTVDRTMKEGKSIKLVKAETTMWKFYNIYDHNLTAADIGRNFKVSVWVKPEADTTVEIGLSSAARGDSDGFTRYNNTFYKKTSASIAAGKWNQVSFEFTVDETMLAETYVGYEDKFYNPALFAIRPANNSTVWVDDITVQEYIDGGYQAVDVSEAATVSPAATAVDDFGVTKSKDAAAEGVKKAYIRFEAGEYENAQSATLNINVEEAAGQTLKVYGITDSAYPDVLTYNTAPGTNSDESMDETKIYGGAALDEIVVSEAGSYSFDVTDYVKANSGSEYIFVITSEDEAVVISKNAELAAEVVEQVSITVSTVGGDSVSINGKDKGDTTTEAVYAGISLDLSAGGDGEFMFWVDANANTILSYDESFSFTAGTDRSIAAVYADKTDVFVTFTSMGNKLISAGLASAITVPADPYVYGYTFDGWYANGEKAEFTAGGAVTADVNTEFKAGFVKNSDTYTVTVNGVNETYTYNEKVTVTAEGESFSYWKRDGEIVSYNTQYSFYVNGNTTVDAVYGESVTAKAVLVMATPVLVEGNKIAFFAERDIPADCELIETGILLDTTVDVSLDKYTNKAIAKSSANKGQYTIRKANVSSEDTWYGVAYAIYRDTSGNIVTAYSNEVSYPVE